MKYCPVFGGNPDLWTLFIISKDWWTEAEYSASISLINAQDGYNDLQPSSAVEDPLQICHTVLCLWKLKVILTTLLYTLALLITPLNIWLQKLWTWMVTSAWMLNKFSLWQLIQPVLVPPEDLLKRTEGGFEHPPCCHTSPHPAISFISLLIRNAPATDSLVSALTEHYDVSLTLIISRLEW